LVARHSRVTHTSKVLTEAYHVTLAELVTLHNKYLASKEVKNVFQRYTLLRDMIKVRAGKAPTPYETASSVNHILDVPASQPVMKKAARGRKGWRREGKVKAIHIHDSSQVTHFAG